MSLEIRAPLSQALDPVIRSSAGAPAAPKIASFSTDSGVVGDEITNDNTLTLTGTAAANSTVTVFDGSTMVGTGDRRTAAVNGHLTTSTLSDGVHSLTATDTDSSGQSSSPSSAFAVTIDTHAPAAPTMAVYSPAGSAVGGITTIADLVLKGTAQANSTIDVFDSGKQIGSRPPQQRRLELRHWAFANGSHSFMSKAVDIAGNTSAASVANAVTVNAPVSDVDVTNMYIEQ